MLRLDSLLRFLRVFSLVSSDLTSEFSSKVLTPKCHLLLLTVFCDRKVFPKAMKGFKSRGEESEEAGTELPC